MPPYSSSTPLCTTATLAITVDDVAPRANDDIASMDEDTILTYNPLENDTDPNSDIDPASLMLIDPTDLTGATLTTSVTLSSGTISLNPLLDGTLIFTPNPDYNGPMVVSYKVCDQTSTIPICDTATVTMTVNQINDTPIVDDASLGTIAEDTSHTYSVIGTDVDNQA